MFDPGSFGKRIASLTLGQTKEILTQCRLENRWWGHWEHFACNDHVHPHDDDEEENAEKHFACNDLYSITHHHTKNKSVCLDYRQVFRILF